MIYPISARTCAEAWLQAVNLLNEMPGRYAYNMILDIEEPVTMTPVDGRIVGAVDRFFALHKADPVATVAGTIFPAAYYRDRGRKGVFEDFPKRVYPKIRKHWVTYAGRMLVRESRSGECINPLEILITKLKKQTARSGSLRSVYEVSLIDIFTDLPIYDPALDATRTLNQPCLAHLSFKLREHDGLILTALYRSHYYVQRTLGNLIGLAQLLFFVANESGLKAAGLVCHSTFARLDNDGGWTVRDVDNLITECNQLVNGVGRSPGRGAGKSLTIHRD